MANYPYVSPADENAQYLTSILSQYKPGTLGNTATIGNPQGQQDYASQLAQALAEMDSATKQQGRAEGMQGAKYIDNSGLLGVAAVLAQQFAGKKMDEKASKKYEDASMRAMTAKDVLDEAKAERAAARALKATQGEQAQRRKDGEAMGLTGRDLTRYALEGKIGEGVRMNTVQGDDGYMYNVDPYNSTSQRVRVGGGQPQPQSQPSMPFQIEGDVPPEVAAAMQSDPAAWENGNSVDIKAPPTYLRGKNTQAEPKFQSRQFTPQEVASMGLPSGTVAYSTEDGSPKIINKPNTIPGGQAATATKPNAMRQDAINFAAAYIGKKPEDVAKMTPEQIRTAVASGNRTMTGPIMGRIPGNAALFNADLEAYANSAAGKKARLNNPTGPVSNADFEIARKSVFSAEKPDAVNADLIYQALTDGATPAQQSPAAAPQPGHVLKYNPQTGEFE